MSGEDPRETIAESAADEILGPNPFIGLRPQDVLASITALVQEAAARPSLVIEQQAALVRDLVGVLAGQSALAPAPGDKRFTDTTWSENPFYRACLGGYLAWIRSFETFVDRTGFDTRTKQQARFVVQLVADALSPSNTLANPAAMKRTLETGGVSVLQGLRNLALDIGANGGMPSQVDKTAFTVGKNLAMSEGSVVWKNEMLELIQYAPRTNQVYSRPLLIIPPQINKFYVFDLAPGRSIVEHLVNSGFQVFIVSWRNPTAEHREWGFDTYIAALDRVVDVVREITGSEDVNLAGACSGAMTLAGLLGYFAAGGRKPVHSAALLVAVLEFPTDTTLGLFATPETVAAAKAASAARGTLDGEEMGRVFAWLRPNDLVWNYWINNYLLGKSPPAFDILYWNNDTTALPARFHGELVDFFVTNRFKQPGAVRVLGEPIDLRQVTIDKFFVAGITDHITPWKSVYRTMMLFGGESELVLSAAGHVQSLINPLTGGSKRQFFTASARPADPDAWLKQAKPTAGSWWPHWSEWLAPRSGEKIAAPSRLGHASFPAGANAPGTYVFE